jgi:RNA recognition motif-containing protein
LSVVGFSDSDGPGGSSTWVAATGNGAVATRIMSLSKKLYVGNLPFNATETEVRELFGSHGAIESVNVITDRDTGRSRGFGFVEFQDESSAQAAQRALDGAEMGGRNLRVNEAHDRRGGGGAPGGGRARY